MEAKISRSASVFLYQSTQGGLATVDIDGVPYASAVNVCADLEGRLVMLVSRLAGHAVNMSKNPAASIVLVDEKSDDWQASPRLTLQGEVQPVAIAQAERYLRLFPQAREYLELEDFYFLALKADIARWIEGYSRAEWLLPEHIASVPWDAEQETTMIEHMNEDHADALAHYVRLCGKEPDGTERLATLDRFGGWIHRKSGLVRFQFRGEAVGPEQAREQLVIMARMPLKR